MFASVLLYWAGKVCAYGIGGNFITAYKHQIGSDVLKMSYIQNLGNDLLTTRVPHRQLLKESETKRFNRVSIMADLVGALFLCYHVALIQVAAHNE